VCVKFIFTNFPAVFANWIEGYGTHVSPVRDALLLGKYSIINESFLEK